MIKQIKTKNNKISTIFENDNFYTYSKKNGESLGNG